MANNEYPQIDIPAIGIVSTAPTELIKNQFTLNMFNLYIRSKYGLNAMHHTLKLYLILKKMGSLIDELEDKFDVAMGLCNGVQSAQVANACPLNDIWINENLITVFTEIRAESKNALISSEEMTQFRTELLNTFDTVLTI